MFSALDNESSSNKKDPRPLSHILNDFKAFGRLEMIADFIEISKRHT